MRPLTFLRTAPASFCKCTCFTNSTIIHLDDPSPYSSKGSSKSDSSKSSGASFFSRAKDSKKTGRTCNDCNKKFCLDYNLPICHNAKEEDVFSECFRMCALRPGISYANSLPQRETQPKIRQLSSYSSLRLSACSSTLLRGPMSIAGRR